MTMSWAEAVTESTHRLTQPIRPSYIFLSFKHSPSSSSAIEEEIIRSKCTSPDAQIDVATVLLNLVNDQERVGMIVDEAGVPVIVKMNKIGLSSLKSFDQHKSLSGSGKTLSMASRPSMDLITSGNFANLKLITEKLVKEQASVKTDLDMVNSKLKKSMEHIRTLEGKLENAFNENAKHKVKQKEDEKLWKGLESKFSTTKTLCDQLTEILQHLL